MLQVAKIGLDAGEPQTRRGVGGAGQAQGVLGIGASAVGAEVEVDDKIQHDAGRDGGVRQPVDLALVIGDRADLGAGAGEGGQASGAPGRDGGGDQDVGDAAGDIGLGFADRLAAQADSAAFDYEATQGGALVGLAVGAQANAGSVAEGLHAGEVAGERRAVDDEEGGLGEVRRAWKVHQTHPLNPLIPAKAGTQAERQNALWKHRLGPRFRGDER